jgi:hypothetical protein
LHPRRRERPKHVSSRLDKGACSELAPYEGRSRALAHALHEPHDPCLWVARGVVKIAPPSLPWGNVAAGDFAHPTPA